MKNIKLRIVYLILCSALLLFALFMLAVNLIIPAHFVREAKKALISEAQYQNRTIPYTDDGSFFDDEWNDTEEHFLTPSIVFLDLDNANQSSGWNRDAYRLEKKLLEYCKGRDLSLNQCYTFKTDRHHLIFMSVQEEQADWGKPYAYIMYIDIGPITRYIVTLNWVFFAVLLAISSVMCLLGFRFGRDIEKEAERQQTFFQNASHELKTPLMAIQGYAEGIQAGVMDAGGAAEVILAESDRMTELVEELLDISKIDMGRQRLTLSETDIRELLYDGIRAVEPAAAGGTADPCRLYVRGLCVVPPDARSGRSAFFINWISPTAQKQEDKTLLHRNVRGIGIALCLLTLLLSLSGCGSLKDDSLLIVNAVITEVDATKQTIPGGRHRPRYALERGTGGF